MPAVPAAPLTGVLDPRDRISEAPFGVLVARKLPHEHSAITGLYENSWERDFEAAAKETHLRSFPSDAHFVESIGQAAREFAAERPAPS
jgi:hypothetical protein